MKNILGYLKKHKLIIIALGIVLIISLILILTLGNKIGNEPKVIENLSCSALNDIKTIIPKNIWSDTALIITNNGDLYTLNEKKYSDETNCKQINGDIKVTGYLITDMSGLFIFGTDESYKYNNDSNQLTLEENIEKFSVIAANGWFSPYYNLKEDGIIYQWKTYDTTTGTFSEEKEFLKFDNEKILDFGIANSEINYIRTDKAYYTRKLANEQECTEYADVECKYELYKDNYLTENYDKVAGIIEGNVIFKNGDVVDYDLENIYRLDEKTNVDVTYNNEKDGESEVIEETQEKQEDNNTTSDKPNNNTTKPNTNNSNQNNNIITYEIYFNTNGGNNINPKILNEKEIVGSLPIPTKEGYLFQYWEYENNKYYNQMDIILENDITLNAVWKKDISYDERLKAREKFREIVEKYGYEIDKGIPGRAIKTLCNEPGYKECNWLDFTLEDSFFVSVNGLYQDYCYYNWNKEAIQCYITPDKVDYSYMTMLKRYEIMLFEEVDKIYNEYLSAGYTVEYLEAIN